MIQRDNNIIIYLICKWQIFFYSWFVCATRIVYCDDSDEKDAIIYIIWEKSTKILVQRVVTYNK